MAWMRILAKCLAFSHTGSELVGRGPLPLFWPGLIPRNLLFLTVVLAHLICRALPPPGSDEKDGGLLFGLAVAVGSLVVLAYRWRQLPYVDGWSAR
jgi:hypothetical protein